MNARLALRATEWLERLDTWTAREVTLASWALVLVLAVGDYLTTATVAFTALYLLPLVFAGWFLRRPAIDVALACVASWLLTELVTRSPRPTTSYFVWNAATQVVAFSALVLLVRGLRRALETRRQALVAEHQRARRAQQQLEHAERLSSVGKLAAGVAHELGTPLNVCSSYAELLEAEGLGPAEVRSSGRIIREQCEAMTRIVRQLVDFARASDSHRGTHDVGEILSSALAMLRVVARKKRVELSSRNEGRPLFVEVDSGKMVQVMFNLVVNAIQAVPTGGRVTVEASLSTEAPPAHIAGGPREVVAVRVRDNGPGIATAVLTSLFEPFVTTKPIGEGTGLGLAVANSLVSEHGGWMTAENAPGGGACFTVYLPRVQAPAVVPGAVG